MIPITANNFKLLFEQLPGLYLILTPDFTIVAVSDLYISTSLTTRANIIGRNIFEAFPDNPDDHNADGVSNLSASLNHVLKYKQAHAMADQKYDISRPDGVFEERYWSPLNTPIFNEQQELIYIIHRVEDITRRKKSEEKFYALLEAAPDATLLVDEMGIITRANAQTEKLFGFTRQEMIGQPVEILLPNKFRAHHVHQRDNFTKVGAGRSMNAKEGLVATKKDGTTFSVDISLSPIHTEEGLYIVTTVRDITLRKKAQEQLQFVSTQVNQTHDAIYAVDANRRITSWNHGAQLLFGFTEEEAIGKDPVELLRTINGEKIIKAALEIVNKKDYWAGTLQRKTKAGTDIFVHTTLNAIRDNNKKITGYFSVGLDVSRERKLQEQLNHLANLVEQSSEAIISRGLDKRLISWNSGAEKMFGYNKAEALGKTAHELGIVKFTAAETDELENELLQKNNWRSEKEYFHKNGRSFFGVATANAVINELGQMTSAVFIIKDISLRRQLEEHLKKSNRELEENVKARTAEIIKSEVKYKHLFQNNPMPMWVMDLATFKFLDVNKMAIVQYGYSREEFLSMTAVDIRPDADKDIFIQSDHPDSITEANYNKGIWNHKKKDGSIIQVEIIVHDIIFENIPARIILSNDITEKKKAEEKLLVSEKLFRALIENSNDIISLMDSAFNLTYRSPAAARITGWTNEDMMGLDATKNIHPEDQEYAAAVVKDVMAHPAKMVTAKFRMQHRLGHYLWVEGTLTNLLQDKFINAVVFNFRNVTERIEAEEKLLASENLFRALIENSNDIIVMLDDTFKVLYRSPSAERITGWQDNEITGFTCAKNIHPNDLEKATTLLMEVLANPGKPIYGKFRNRHKNGHYQWMEGVAINLLHEKNVKAIVFNSRDITERVEAEQRLLASEERYRNSLDNMLEGVQIIGFDWRYIYVNDAMTKHGKCEKEKLLGRTVMEVYPGIEQTEIFKVYQRCFNERVPIHLENEFKFADKSKGWFELSFQPVPEGIFILSVDITERKNDERKIIESEENLKAIFDNVAEGFILTDAGGIVKVYNCQALESILLNMQGWIQIGKSLFNCIHPEQKNYFKNIIAKVNKGETIQFSRSYTTSKGRQIWIDLNFSPVISNGQIKGICITGRDITTEKIAQQQKDFDRSNLNALINNTTDVMWSIDRNFNLITSNQAFNKKIQGLYGEMPEPGSSIFKPLTDKEERVKHEITYSRAFNGETFTEVAHQLVPDEIWTEISFNPIFKEDHIIGTACFSRDITASKKAEVLLNKNFEEKKILAARMSSILNTLPANIALLNKNGIIIDINDSWRRFAIDNGFNGYGYGIGCDYLTISKNAKGREADTGVKVAAGIKAVLENKKKEFVFEYPCHSPNEERWFRMIVTPLLEKKYSGAVVMHIDISEIRRLEQARLKSSIDEQKRITMAILQGQEKERNYIGKELHDNVNQILAGTKLFLTSAAHKNETVKELIKYPIELLNSSIEEIRLLCRNLVSPIKNIDLEDLVKGLLAHCNENVKPVFTYDVPKNLLSDDLKLNIYRIMQELVNNTMKYAEAKNLSIAIQSENKELCIIVTDDGKGFDVKSKREGIGISNINNRVESFDGGIEIKSSPGKGCKTIINIPVS